MEKYIEVMELRLRPGTRTRYSFPAPADKTCRVAPLLFIPLIENAFKHGISAGDGDQIFFELMPGPEWISFTPGTIIIRRVHRTKAVRASAWSI